MAFLNVIVPIFVVMAFGYGLARRRPMDLRPVTSVLMYLFMPAITFSAIVHNPLTAADIGGMIGVSLLIVAITLPLGLLGGRLLRLDRAEAAAVLGSTLLFNTGNYGASASLFAWGEDGFQKAIVFMAIHNISASLAAIYVSARGTSGARESLRAVLRQPLFAAAVVAAAVRLAGIEAGEIPLFIMRPIDLIADGTVPTALILLGMQLSGIRPDTRDLSVLGMIAALRLVLVPFAVYLVFWVTGVSGILRDVLLLQSAMPTAIIAVVYASEFETRPDLVGGSVVATTLGSLLTISLLLQLFGVG